MRYTYNVEAICKCCGDVIASQGGHAAPGTAKVVKKGYRKRFPKAKITVSESGQ
jgi:hypothetical protein